MDTVNFFNVFVRDILFEFISFFQYKFFVYFKSICVHFKSRFNSNLKRNDVLSEVSSLFLNLGDKVDLKNPDFVIVLEIMKVVSRRPSQPFYASRYMFILRLFFISILSYSQLAI